MAYTELFFVDKLWPEVTKDDILEIFKEYQQRERRCGLWAAPDTCSLACIACIACITCTILYGVYYTCSEMIIIVKQTTVVVGEI